MKYKAICDKTGTPIYVYIPGMSSFVNTVHRIVYPGDLDTEKRRNTYEKINEKFYISCARCCGIVSTNDLYKNNITFCLVCPKCELHSSYHLYNPSSDIEFDILTIPKDQRPMTVFSDAIYTRSLSPNPEFVILVMEGGMGNQIYVAFNKNDVRVDEKTLYQIFEDIDEVLWNNNNESCLSYVKVHNSHDLAAPLNSSRRWTLGYNYVTADLKNARGYISNVLQGSEKWNKIHFHEYLLPTVVNELEF